VLSPARSAATCKRAWLSLAWPSGHPRRRPPRCWSGRAPAARGRPAPTTALPGRSRSQRAVGRRARRSSQASARRALGQTPAFAAKRASRRHSTKQARARPERQRARSWRNPGFSREKEAPGLVTMRVSANGHGERGEIR
jgi:hypothetical protein